MNPADCRIVAPVASPEQVRRLCDAGAHELYLGIMPGDWRDRFSDADLLSRRQGAGAHFTDWDELERALGLAHPRGRRLALVLNQRYTPVQEAAVLAMVRRWESIGGDALVLADPGLIWTLHRDGCRCEVQVSLMGCVFNAAGAALFAGLGAGRIILPRELTLAEMGALAARSPAGLEYEAMVLHQRCPFIDGLCGFYHGTRISDGHPALFDYRQGAGDGPCVADSLDPGYEGHGCQLDWTWAGGPVGLPGFEQRPTCAACQIGALAAAGVRYLKLGGRGYPIEALESSVRFIRTAIDLLGAGPDPRRSAAAIRISYGSAFGAACDEGLCYYRGGR